jgi:hypothetical protein
MKCNGKICSMNIGGGNMKREAFKEVLRINSERLFGNTSQTSLSQSLSFFVVRKLMEINYGYTEETDIYNGIIDGKNDRGFDLIYIDDVYEYDCTAYIIQTKYSDDGNIITVDEKEAQRFINNIKRFPGLNGEVNGKLMELSVIYQKLVDQGIHVKKRGIIVTLGRVSSNAQSILDDAEIEIYDYDRINLELLLDEYLPSFPIELKNEPSNYNNDSFLGILNIGVFVKNQMIADLIKKEGIFAYNIRGKMKNSKNSIAQEIINTCKDNPHDLFNKNNGLTIICQDFIASDNIYELKRASIINGQQTVRAILSEINNIPEYSHLYVPVRVIRIDGVTHDTKKKIISYAKSNNTQYGIKTADLYSNEPEQKHIADTSAILPDPIKFEYINKRTFNDKSIGKRFYREKEMPRITKEEAIIHLHSFILLNPNDRSEDLFKTSYDKLFKNTLATHIGVMIQIRKHIEYLHEQSDMKAPTNKLFRDKFYVKFKKQRIVNYCLYLLGVFLQQYFGKVTENDRKNMLEQIYEKMCSTKDYRIENYFNEDFWRTYNRLCQRFLSELYHENTVDINFFRKALDDWGYTKIKKIYDNVLFDEAVDKIIDPKTLI